jgi:hypothetical protein
MSEQTNPGIDKTQPAAQEWRRIIEMPMLPPVPNYTLATACPNCDAPVVRRACKVRCERCGFMWDCSEL